MKFLLITVFLFSLCSCQLFIQKNECINQLPRFRSVWKFVPNEIQTNFIREITSTLLGLRVFRNSSREILTKTLVDLGDDKVEVPTACSNAQKNIGEPLEIVQQCISKCIDSADLTLIRLITTVFKCTTNQECYMTELQTVLRILVPCVQKCV